MGIWKTIKAAFATGISTPPDARRLSAVDELALSASLRDLPVGERGWITLSEARALFSPMDDRYAFGEMDEVGHARHFLAHTEQALFGLCKKRANSESTSMHWQVPVYSRTISQTYNRPRAIPRSKSWQRIRQRAAACGAVPRS